MDINEVSEILGLCHFLRAPKHVFITEETVSSKEDGVTYYRGLQPKYKGDSIFLSAQMDQSTPIHETIHTYGIDELGTDVLTRIILRKNKILQNFTLLKDLTKKKLIYEKVESSSEYPEAHMEKFKGRVEHYVLVSER